MTMRVWLLALWMGLVGGVTAEPAGAQAQFTPLGVPNVIATRISGNGKPSPGARELGGNAALIVRLARDRKRRN
jgi:hypothetical protein